MLTKNGAVGTSDIEYVDETEFKSTARKLLIITCQTSLVSELEMKFNKSNVV